MENAIQGSGLYNSAQVQLNMIFVGRFQGTFLNFIGLQRWDEGRSAHRSLL